MEAAEKDEDVFELTELGDLLAGDRALNR